MGKYSTKAEALARAGHQGQFRHDGVTPYIVHVQQVAELARVWHPNVDEFEAAAWLHDYLEDVLKVNSKEGMMAAITFLEKEGFTTSTIATVVYMTRLPDQTYEFYLESVKINPWAKSLKAIDNLCNLADSPSKNQVKKYAKSLKFLLSP